MSPYNTIQGLSAGNPGMTGELVALYGYATGNALTSGTYITAIGAYALAQAKTVNNIIAIGPLSCFSMTDGDSHHIGIGTNTLRLMTGGAGCIAIGDNSLANARGVYNCVAIGLNAFSGPIVGTGVDPTSPTTGDSIAVGNNTLRSVVHGFFNNTVGVDSMTDLTDGACDNFFGYAAGQHVTTASRCVMFGHFAGNEHVTGDDCSFFGSGSGGTDPDVTNATAIGAGVKAGSNEIVLGLGTQTARIPGAVVLPNLPTADPHAAGQVWNNAGVLSVSAG